MVSHSQSLVCFRPGIDPKGRLLGFILGKKNERRELKSDRFVSGECQNEQLFGFETGLIRFVWNEGRNGLKRTRP